MPPSPQIQHIRCLDTKKRKDKNSCEISEKAKSNSKPPARNNVIGKEKIRLVTQDLIRDLIVPKTEPNLYPAVMEKSDLKRLKNQAKVITTKDRLEMLEQAEALKNQEMKESMARKAEIKKYEKQREKGAKLTEVEQEAKRQALHLLHRAFEMRQEQEDEVKKANRLILGTKCHAIRDAQIAEKKLIIKELEEEERRLDQMMEQERKDALYKEEQRRDKKKTEKQNYVHYIMEQIKEGEIQKIIEAERIEEECRMINEAQMAMQLDDLKNQKKRVAEQQKMREELRKANEQLLYFQDLEREEERIADLRVQEYMKQKAAREAAREEELKLQKMAKEREIARLRALQQRQQDLQAEMDELNAQRIQDEVEREWRKKEREAAKKKAEEDIAMKKARELQIQDRRRMQALEIAREKKEFESVLKVQIESAEKSKLENLKKKNETEAYRGAILKQINEKERERIKCRKELFEEGLVMKREEQLREKHMREIMNKKIDELRQHKVPEVYVKEIEKQLNLV